MGTDVTELFIVIAVIAVALIFDYTDGFHDSANAMAGPIATGAIRPRWLGRNMPGRGVM
jgi:inorganic phosphate transporter, PiT family